MQSTNIRFYLITLKRGDDGVQVTCTTAVTWQLWQNEFDSFIFICYGSDTYDNLSIIHKKAFYFNSSPSIMWRSDKKKYTF